MKIKQVHMFRRGLNAGALSLLLEAPQDPHRAVVSQGSIRLLDRKAFFKGYEIGYEEKYVKAYLEKDSLIELAVSAGDVVPEGWYVHIDPIESTRSLEETE